MPPSLPTNSSELPIAPDSAVESTLDLSPEEFLNRDLSWLEFNQRILHEAIDARTPLLERVRFLGIVSSNLDEFFMKRVGALQRQLASNGDSRSIAPLAPERHLHAIRQRVAALLRRQAECWTTDIRPALAANGIHLLSVCELDPTERGLAEEFFQKSVFPILTPLAVDFVHPFPFISNLSISLGLVLQHPQRSENLFARIKVPETLPRWVRLPQRNGTSEFRFYDLHELLRTNLNDLFPAMKVLDTTFFRVTRSADLEVEDDDTEDQRDYVRKELHLRRFAPAVRLEHAPGANAELLSFLGQELEISPDSIYEVPGELTYQDLRPIADLKLPALSYPAWTPRIPAPLADQDADIFATIRSGDLLVHHPYDSFNASVERFISAAAVDPKVLAIKMTLYRTDEQSPFIATLIRAAEEHKQVVCVVELKARFDEERNITLAHALEEVGVHVVYGVVGLKTHAKAALVVRQDPDGIRCYAHIGTGNYHTQTARQYTDLGLFTTDPLITGDIVNLFHYLTGRSLKSDYQKLLVAPVNMRTRFLESIEGEIQAARAGGPAHIIAKMNSLEDHEMIRALYRASQAGVVIDLVVRGFCCLRPGVPGLSERIRVRSIVGRFLEHSRIFYFRSGTEDPLAGRFFIGSADWMYRNLFARVEAVVPIEHPAHRQQLWHILQTMVKDNRQAWDMHPDGTYTQSTPTTPDDIGTHQLLMRSIQTADGLRIAGT